MILGLEEEIYRMSLNILLCQKAKRPLKTTRVGSKGPRSNMKKLPRTKNKAI